MKNCAERFQRGQVLHWATAWGLPICPRRGGRGPRKAPFRAFVLVADHPRPLGWKGLRAICGVDGRRPFLTTAATRAASPMTARLARQPGLVRRSLVGFERLSARGTHPRDMRRSQDCPASGRTTLRAVAGLGGERHGARFGERPAVWTVIVINWHRLSLTVPVPTARRSRPTDV